MPAASPPMAPGTTQAQSAAMAANQAIANNAATRAFLLGNSVPAIQSIFNTLIATPGSQNNVIRIPFSNVGFVTGFIVKISGTLTQLGGSDSATPATNWNIANVLSNVTLFDMDNYQRVNCAGWFLQMIGTAKEGFPQGAALLLTAFDTPVKYGNNFNALTLTAPTTAAAGSFEVYYWVPCSYTAQDLRGAIWAGVVNATAYLQLTLNPTPWAAQGTDGTLAVLQSTGGTHATPPTFSNVTVQVYQCYRDQCPRYTQGPYTGSPILPNIDVSTQYRLNTTSLTGVSTGQDFPIPFTNFQQFLSLGIIFDQNGTLNGGTDVNYFALAAANTYQQFKVDATTQAWMSRHKIKTDWPLGSYMFDFRTQPISTNQTGNMQLLLNAAGSIAAQTQVLAGFEALALINTVLGAASLPAS